MSSNHREHREFSERATLERVLAPILAAYDAELVDLELVGAPGGRILRIYVEKAGSAERNESTEAASVVVDTCARIARDLSPALDVADVIKGRYHLEVSTPGVERALHHRRDFLRFAGKKARVTVQPPVEGQNVHTGQLAGVEGEGETYLVLVTNDQGKTIRIPSVQVARANLVFDFGPKSGPKSSRGGNPKNSIRKNP